MKKYETIALNNFLSNYPDNKTYHEILELIENNDESILIWSPFEDYLTEDIIHYIENLCDEIKSNYETEEYAQSIKE